MIVGLMMQAHRFVLSDCRDVVTTLRSAAFKESLALLQNEGLSPMFADELDLRLNTYEARYLSRETHDEAHRAESEDAQAARAAAKRLHDYLETRVRFLLNRNDPRAPHLARVLRYQRASFDSLSSASENLGLMLIQLRTNPEVSRLGLRATFQAECEAALAAIPTEHAQAVDARVSREVDTSMLRVQNDTITQMMEELLILADAVHQTYGNELVGLDLALLRSRAAPTSGSGSDAPATEGAGFA